MPLLLDFQTSAESWGTGPAVECFKDPQGKGLGIAALLNEAVQVTLKKIVP